ncbi:MAG: hypothetical protein A3F68_00825 [Acidobacteria bacterium RIFCSPLOWO2_12_FULL_54_10]|nr:MAG: hypothetical protein A3F68_00825 [Acidobacteria bacterium RIFCSPLOWO2_12_FULL_54_10]
MLSRQEFLLLHPIYAGIAEKELGHGIPYPACAYLLRDDVDSAADAAVAPETEHWLNLLDFLVTPHRLRVYLLETNAEETILQALLRYLAGKKKRSAQERDKVDWLVTHIFRMREERQGKLIGWPKPELEEMLSGIQFKEPSSQTESNLLEIPFLLDEAKQFNNFREMTESGIVQRVRDLKNNFGEDFFHPEVLAAIIHYNLLFGRKFRKLLEETVHRVRQLVKPEMNEGIPDTRELLQIDYRAASNAFKKIVELDRKEPPAKTPTVSRTSTSGIFASLTREEHLRNMGINSGKEAEALKIRVQELRVRCRANPTLKSLPSAHEPLDLMDWELAAMRNELPENEESFRVEFTQELCQSVGIIYRIHEEIPLHKEKKEPQEEWKKHYDSLVYLLFEGNEKKASLARLSAQCQQRGLLEKAKQLQWTAERLEKSLSKVASLI